MGDMNHQSTSSFIIEEMRQSLSRLMKKKIEKKDAVANQDNFSTSPSGTFDELLYILPDKGSSYFFRFEVV